jgi:hypothetical protein
MEFRTIIDRKNLTKVASCFNRCEAVDVGAVYEKEGYKVIGSINDIDDGKYGVYVEHFVSPEPGVKP